MHDIFLWKQVFTTWYLVFPVDHVTICLQAVSGRKSWLLTHCLFARQQLLKPMSAATTELLSAEIITCVICLRARDRYCALEMYNTSFFLCSRYL